MGIGILLLQLNKINTFKTKRKASKKCIKIQGGSSISTTH